MGAIRNLGRKIVRNSVFDTVMESIGPGLTWEQRKMRVACRSNILRQRAIGRAVARQNVPVFPTASGHRVSGPRPDQVISHLNEKGFAAGISISDATLTEILDYCSRATFTSATDPTRKVPIDSTCDKNPLGPGHYIYSLSDAYARCEAVSQLVHDPFVVSIAREYLHREPVLGSCSIWWSYPHLDQNGSPLWTPSYGYHYDLGDYKFLGLFIHLNDVDRETGPHVIISGTHKKRTVFEKLHRRLTDNQAVERYGKQITVMTGKRGSGFFEDTFCYHKGEHPRKPRLILNAWYSFSKYY